jgi:hypothetical protein
MVGAVLSEVVLRGAWWERRAARSIVRVSRGGGLTSSRGGLNGVGWMVDCEMKAMAIGVCDRRGICLAVEESVREFRSPICIQLR